MPCKQHKAAMWDRTMTTRACGRMVKKLERRKNLQFIGRRKRTVAPELGNGPQRSSAASAIPLIAAAESKFGI